MNISIEDINKTIDLPFQPPHGLGRLVAIDKRDFEMKPALRLLGVDTQPLPKSKYWNDSGWWGNQWQTPKCVGYALGHYMEDGPVTHTEKTVQPVVEPDDIYAWANANDEWAADGPHDGTSVRAGAEYLLKQGWIKSYHFTQDIEEFIRALLTVGPIPVGTVWFNSMFDPASNGVLSVSRSVGDIAGGHAYEVNGYNMTTELFRFKQSWGRQWGMKGHAYIKKIDMAYLLEQQGEAMLMIENKNRQVA